MVNEKLLEIRKKLKKEYGDESAKTIAEKMNSKIKESLKRKADRISKISDAAAKQLELSELQQLMSEIVGRTSSHYSTHNGSKAISPHIGQLSTEEIHEAVSTKKISYVSDSIIGICLRRKDPFDLGKKALRKVLLGLGIPRNKWPQYLEALYEHKNPGKTKPDKKVPENDEEEKKIRAFLEYAKGSYYCYFADIEADGVCNRVARNILRVKDNILSPKENGGKILPDIEYTIKEGKVYKIAAFLEDGGQCILVLQGKGAKHRIALRFFHPKTPNADVFLGTFSAFGRKPPVMGYPRSGYEVIWKQKEGESLKYMDLTDSANFDLLKKEEWVIKSFLQNVFPTIVATEVSSILGDKNSLESLVGKNLKERVWEKLKGISKNLNPNFLNVFQKQINKEIDKLKSAIRDEQLEFEIDEIVEFRNLYDSVLKILERDLEDAQGKGEGYQLLVSSMPSREYYWSNQNSSTERRIESFVQKGGKIDRYFFLRTRSHLDEEAKEIVSRHFSLLNQDRIESAGNIYLIKLWKIPYLMRDNYFHLVALAESGKIAWEVKLRRASDTIKSVLANSHPDYLEKCKLFFESLEALDTSQKYTVVDGSCDGFFDDE